MKIYAAMKRELAVAKKVIANPENHTQSQIKTAWAVIRSARNGK